MTSIMLLKWKFNSTWYGLLYLKKKSTFEYFKILQKINIKKYEKSQESLRKWIW